MSRRYKFNDKDKLGVSSIIIDGTSGRLRRRRRNLFYMMWVDGITKFSSNPENKGIWKFYAMVFTTMAMAMNLALILSILQRNILKHSFYYIPVKLFKSETLNSLISFFILYFSIPFLINYFLIFRNNRYEILINRYESHGGKLYASYLVISYFLPFILLLIAFLI